MIYAGLLFFFVLEYVRIGSFVPGVEAVHLNSLLPLMVFVGTVLGTRPVSNGEVLRESNTRLLGVFLALIVASVLVANVTMAVVETLTMVLGYVLVYFVIVRQTTDLRRIKGVFATMIGVHLIMIALTPEMITSPNQRHYVAYGTFLGDGNDFALSVDIVIPLCLFLFSDARSFRGKLFAGGSLLMLLLAVVATQSRGGTLALGAMAAYYWWKSPRKLVTSAGAVLALLVALAFAPPEYFDRMNTISEYETDGSAQGRITAWKAGTAMMLSNPVFGVGAGQFPANYTRFAPGEVRWKTAHSIYFLILGELGIPGIVLLLTIILHNLAANRRLATRIAATATEPPIRALRLLACLSASLIAFAVAGAFLSALYYPHMYVLAGLLAAGRRIAALEASPSAARALAAAPSRLAPAFSPRSVAVMTRPRVDGSTAVTHHGRFF